ncbi:MAG: CHASE2 domain-containing protein [Desulfobacterium sp.]|nr:CHASE2 domain-containing protein [Desulfobacterium sp.]
MGIILITLAFGTGSYFNTSFFKSIDYFFYDQFMKCSVAGEPSDKIRIIDIDEVSLSAVGQWPWPRYRLAQLVEAVSDMQPKAMGLDIILSEPDRVSLENIQRQFKEDFDLNLGFTGVPLSLRDNDGYLAHVFKKTGIVGAKYFYFDYFNKESICNHNPFEIRDRSGLLRLHQATGVLCNTDQIENKLAFTGFMNNRRDEDGILRQSPLLIEFQGDIFPNLALATFLKAHGITQGQVLKGLYGLYLEAGQYKIPVTPNGYVQMRFSGPATRDHKFISAVDILNNNVPQADIRDKIIFIGSSAVGLNDIHHTIFDSQFPGVEIHAVILDNIYKNRMIIRPIRERAIVLVGCLITGMLMAFLFFKPAGPKTLFFATLIWVCVVFIATGLAYNKLSVFISPGMPVLMAVVLFTFFSYARFVQARRASFMWFKRLANSQQLTMEAMVSMVETRDPETGQHIKRTQHYALALAKYLKETGKFPELLTDDYIATLFLSVPLHDIGKVGIPDNILLKPGKLTDEEFELMKRHASYGKDTIEKTAKKIKGDNYLKMGAEIAGSHHEKWDGNGYPTGLVGEEIPLSGRIMAISDVYDALISRRCYKPPFPHEKSMQIIREGRGSLFDPVIVDAFFEIEPEIKIIAGKFKD